MSGIKILVTGFGPFPGVEINPTGAVIDDCLARVSSRSACKYEARGHILPTEYAGAGQRIQELIRQVEPDAVLMLGVAAARGELNLERFALNIDDAVSPDAAGAIASGTRIERDGPTAYTSTLPLQRIKQALDKAQIPTVFSNHAGTYVCNHVFYVAAHALGSMGTEIPYGFVHIPVPNDAAGPEDGATRLTAGQIADGIMVILDCLGDAFAPSKEDGKTPAPLDPPP